MYGVSRSVLVPIEAMHPASFWQTIDPAAGSAPRDLWICTAPERTSAGQDLRGSFHAISLVFRPARGATRNRQRRRPSPRAMYSPDRCGTGWWQPPMNTRSCGAGCFVARSVCYDADTANAMASASASACVIRSTVPHLFLMISLQSSPQLLADDVNGRRLAGNHDQPLMPPHGHGRPRTKSLRQTRRIPWPQDKTCNSPSTP